MVLAWERRVRAAIVRHADAPFGDRLEAGLLVARSNLCRWMRRAGMALLAATALAAATAGAALALVLQAL